MGNFGSAVTIAAIIVQTRAVTSREDDRRDLALYCLVALFVGISAFFGFLKIVRYPTQPGYDVVLMGLTAVAVEGALSALSNHWWKNVGCALLAVGIVAWSSAGLWRNAHSPEQISTLLPRSSRRLLSRETLLGVTPWYLGITFARYYHGTAPWITLPAIEDHRVHRYDLLKKRMTAINPIDSVLATMANALRSGHRVWIVGNVWYDRPDQPPPVLAPAPHDAVGWSERAYMATWSMQAVYFLKTHASGADIFSPKGGPPINPYENAKLILVQSLQNGDPGKTE